MSRPRRFEWGLPEAPPPKHPYRDTLLIYGALALVIVIVSWATGGNVARAFVIAVAFYVAASVWSIARWRTRLRAAAAAAREREERL